MGGRKGAASATMAASFPQPSMTLSPYETSDVYLASYLLCMGAALVGTERVGPRRMVFRFASDEYLHSLLRVYWSNDRVPVPPLLLFTALRRLKSRIRRRPQPNDTGMRSQEGVVTPPPSSGLTDDQ